MDQYRASYRANVACSEAIDAAISKHYYDNTLHPEAVAQVVDTFGFERMLYVLANTVQHRENDECISRKSLAWAKTVPIHEDGGAGAHSRSDGYCVAQAHSVKLDLFVEAALHEYLLSRPLISEEITNEAKRVHDCLQAAPEPNSPGKTHFIAGISPDFMKRASPQDLKAFVKLFPYKSMKLITMSARKGVFASISGDESRDKKLRQPRPSVVKKIREQSPETPPNNSAKSRNRELE